MKKVVYEGFGKGARKFEVESTGMKAFGKALWVDKDGQYWEVSYARLAKVWAATRYDGSVIELAK